MSDNITLPRATVEQALEALWQGVKLLNYRGGTVECLPLHDAITALRAALAQQAEPTKETTMPITDDQGKALLPQYRVIEQDGNWMLLYDQMQVGEKVRHEFRIQKLRHDIALYPGISLAEAQKRFRERVEADNE